MADWLTAQEIAEAALPGMPTTKRSVNRTADRDGWVRQTDASGKPLARRRPGRGGALEYHVSLLPGPARSALKVRTIQAKGSSAKALTGTVQPQPDTFTEADMLRRDARLSALMMADAFFAEHRSLGQRASDAEFCERYNTALIDVPAWIREAVPSVSWRSLHRWRSKRDAGNWHGVGGNRRGRKKSSLLETAADGEVATYIGGLLVHQPFLTADHVRDLVTARFGAMLATGHGEKPVPSVRIFQRFIRSWKATNARALSSITDPDRFKSHTRLAGSNAYGHVRELNQLWEIDASPADVLLKEGRYNLYALVDVYSRRMMAYVTQTPRTDAVLLLVRRAIIAWGVPETIRTDNGSDFVSRQFVRAMHSLGIRQDVTAPFSPEQKGIVERAIGTLQRGLMPLLPGFVGHSVADRKSIEARKAFAQRLGESDDRAFCVDLDADELQTAIDRWCEDKYAHKPHAGIDGDTPFNKAAAWRGAIKAIANERALDLLLAPVAGSDGSRTVTKQGIRLDGAYYFAPQLVAGTKVFCRQDPEDMGRLIVFSERDGTFICEAICPTRAGVDPRAAVKAARQAQAEMIREETAAVRKAARKIKPRDMVNDLLGKAQADRASVTPFPRARDTHTTRDLEQAAAALDAPEAIMPAPAETPADDGKVHRLPETPKQRFARAIKLREAVAAGADVAPEDARWLGGYENTPEFRSHMQMLEDFGREWIEA